MEVDAGRVRRCLSDQAKDEAIREFIDKRKASMPDAQLLT
jgi:hypothetical protein